MKTRRRFYFVNTNSYPEKCTRADYEFWKKDFSDIRIHDPKKHSRGWSESVYNGFGVLVGYVL
ncbi:MAG: hypothetical protein M1510_09490 [Nitrospirae bacterium]|nr:hypothetical protein [Nitrospirota bacterium]